MKLVFIYGPPATGKLTVAKELAKITDYKVLHNHLTMDLIGEVLDFGTKDFFDLSRKFRLHLFEAAAKSKVNGVIFTFCYANNIPTDQKFVKDTIKIIKKYRGDVLFVHLFCPKSILEKRVIRKSRRKFQKIKDIKTLNQTMKKWEFFTSIPFVKSYKLDNTTLSPKKVALIIKEHYKLSEGK